jgi:DNA-binding HxlR family transcriptional regulator
MNGPKRYLFIKKHAHGITKKVLTEQLRELETMGLIQKSDNGEFPRIVIYSFTEYGQTITPLIKQMCDWTNDYADKNGIPIISSGEVENE